MAAPKLVMATRNRGKAEELKALLGDLTVEILTLDHFSGLAEIAETGASFRENACLKAHAVAGFTKLSAWPMIPVWWSMRWAASLVSIRPVLQANPPVMSGTTPNYWTCCRGAPS